MNYLKIISESIFPHSLAKRRLLLWLQKNEDSFARVQLFSCSR